MVANEDVVESALPHVSWVWSEAGAETIALKLILTNTHCSPKDYYDAAKRNDNGRKIMQIPLFLGAIAIFYVSGERSPLHTIRLHTLSTHKRTHTPVMPLYTPEQRQRQGQLTGA
jgi:hypothetical protein